MSGDLPLDEVTRVGEMRASVQEMVWISARSETCSTILGIPVLPMELDRWRKRKRIRINPRCKLEAVIHPEGWDMALWLTIITVYNIPAIPWHSDNLMILFLISGFWEIDIFLVPTSAFHCVKLQDKDMPELCRNKRTGQPVLAEKNKFGGSNGVHFSPRDRNGEQCSGLVLFVPYNVDRLTPLGIGLSCGVWRDIGSPTNQNTGVSGRFQQSMQCFSLIEMWHNIFRKTIHSWLEDIENFDNIEEKEEDVFLKRRRNPKVSILKIEDRDLSKWHFEHNLSKRYRYPSKTSAIQS